MDLKTEIEIINLLSDTEEEEEESEREIKEKGESQSFEDFIFISEEEEEEGNDLDYNTPNTPTLINDDDNNSVKTPQLSYYQRAFNSILSTVIEVYASILTDPEILFLKSILTDLTDSAQRLFIRLYLRKSGWQRVNKLQYNDISDTTEAVRSLANTHFCSLDSDFVSDYCTILTLPELKTVASKLFITSTSSSRDEYLRLIETAKEKSGQQRISFTKSGSLASSSTGTNKLAIVKEHTGPIIKINEDCRLLIETVISLYFLVSQSDTRNENLSTAILVEINRRSYPKYKIIRTAPIFTSRRDYSDYQIALQTEIDLIESGCEEVRKDQVDEIKLKFKESLQSCDMSRSYFLRRYTAGWVYCRILSQLAGIVESFKQYYKAVDLYRMLLAQNTFCLGYRGKWWERLVLDTSKHLKDPQGAIKYCTSALSDPSLRTAALTSIKRRLKKLQKNPLSSADENSYSFEEEVPEIITIQGRIRAGNETGRKVQLHMDGDDLALGSVEDFVLNEFEQDGWKGIHSESSCFTTLFALFFWDLLFDTELPDVFQTAYQTAPLDLTTDAFYPLRKDSIELRLKMIEDQFDDAILLLRTHHLRHHNLSCVGVNWNTFGGEAGIDILLKISRGIGGMALSLILRQFCEDYRHNRSGMPDLILWRDCDDSIAVSKTSALIEHANGVLFSEVKSPNDRLSDGQRHWFSILKSAGLRVVLVKVLNKDLIENKRNKKTL